MCGKCEGEGEGEGESGGHGSTAQASVRGVRMSARVREVNAGEGSRHTTLALAITEANHAVVLAKLLLNRFTCKLEVIPNIANAGYGGSMFTVYLHTVLFLVSITTKDASCRVDGCDPIKLKVYLCRYSSGEFCPGWGSSQTTCSEIGCH